MIAAPRTRRSGAGRGGNRWGGWADPPGAALGGGRGLLRAGAAGGALPVPLGWLGLVTIVAAALIVGSIIRVPGVLSGRTEPSQAQMTVFFAPVAGIVAWMVGPALSLCSVPRRRDASAARGRHGLLTLRWHHGWLLERRCDRTAPAATSAGRTAGSPGSSRSRPARAGSWRPRRPR